MGNSSAPNFWRSSNPKFGVVRAVIYYADYVAIFDDLNSDLAEVTLTLMRAQGNSWAELLELDDAGLPTLGESREEGWALDEDGRYVGYALGRTTPGAIKKVTFESKIMSVVSDSSGWWLCAAPAADAESAGMTVLDEAPS